jgi:DNA-binding GntR family transcriptional regulator
MAERGMYRRIAEDLRQRILSAELPAGVMVPSEAALAKQYGVARGTARAALSVLAGEGLIETQPGQGRRVSGTPTARPAPTTAYERIAADLADRLKAGEFAPSAPLPSESALMTDYGVSRNTARRAYQRLVEVGAVVIRQGAGAYPSPGAVGRDGLSGG